MRVRVSFIQLVIISAIVYLAASGFLDSKPRGAGLCGPADQEFLPRDDEAREGSLESTWMDLRKFLMDLVCKESYMTRISSTSASKLFLANQLRSSGEASTPILSLSNSSSLQSSPSSIPTSLLAAAQGPTLIPSRFLATSLVPSTLPNSTSLPSASPSAIALPTRCPSISPSYNPTLILSVPTTTPSDFPTGFPSRSTGPTSISPTIPIIPTSIFGIPPVGKYETKVEFRL